MVEPMNEQISLSRQCELVGISRSGWYYQAVEEDAQDLLLKRLLDEPYTRTPFYGSRRMTVWLRNQGHLVNRKRVSHLMQEMGLEALYPKPRTSQASSENRVYPYLLRGRVMDHSNQVWSADITYIRLARGFLYLVAILDWFSRYVLAWELSNTLETHFCLVALEKALKNGTPEIFNTDQGVQFTDRDFTGCLQSHQIQISMDGRGRALDNIFVERLWRSVKYEEVYLKDYQTAVEARLGLSGYFSFYNDERPHQSLDYRTPEQVYLKESCLAA